MKNRVMLLVIDGWGMRIESEGNAIVQANTPHWDKALLNCASTTLDASGDAVGLRPGRPWFG